MKRYRPPLELTSVIVILAVGVLLPVLLLTAVGIVALVIARDVGGIVMGVLATSFAVAAMGGALVTVVLAGRKAHLARLQADFIANVSHEFRTPLSAIRLYTQTLQTGELAGDPAQTARCLATILRETEWLDVLVDRVLTWRASSSERMPLTLRVESVSAAVHGATDRFRSMVPGDEVALSVAIDTRLNVRHDAAALNSVVLNLLTNAYRYTGKEKRIEVCVRDEKDGVAIEVRDNGIGMTPAQARRIFRPFYRVEQKEGGASGVGLGLAIARYLVLRQGGTLSVASEPGRGSSFVIRLPRAGEGGA